tara:strand:+ start:6999 stop:7334 length:336 start_codon:yes stop_codon:yes gene_type:complete
MAKKYIVTASPGVVPAGGYHVGGGVYVFELEDKVLADLQKQYPTAFDVVSKEEYEETKKKTSSPSSVIESAPTQPPSAPPAEEESKVEVEEALKVTKVKAPEAPKKKKGKA